MVQFKVLSGKMAGTEQVARRFPFRMGRGQDAHLRLEDPGVWDDHARVEFRPSEGFVLIAEGDALLAVNDQPVRERLLRSGDRISAGSARMSFWLAETRQRGLTLREAMAWGCVGLATAGQLTLLYWLLR